MTQSEIDKTLKTNYLELPFGNKIEHYSSVIASLMLGLVLLFLSMNIETEFDVKIKFASLSLFFISLSFLCYKLQKKRLKMTVIETNLSNIGIYKIIEKTAVQLEWYVSHNELKTVFIGETFPPFKSGSWGEQITILIEFEKIFINSICETQRHSSMVSFGRNKKNVDVFIKNIQEQQMNVRAKKVGI